MSLHLEVVCTEPDPFQMEWPENQVRLRKMDRLPDDRRRLNHDPQVQTVRAIGEILPFVLAKYRIETVPSRH